MDGHTDSLTMDVHVRMDGLTIDGHTDSLTRENLFGHMHLLQSGIKAFKYDLISKLQIFKWQLLKKEGP